MSSHKKLGGSSPKSKNLRYFFKKETGKHRESSCHVNSSYIFRIFCIKDNDNQ